MIMNKCPELPYQASRDISSKHMLLIVTSSIRPTITILVCIPIHTCYNFFLFDLIGHKDSRSHSTILPANLNNMMQGRGANVPTYADLSSKAYLNSLSLKQKCKYNNNKLIHCQIMTTSWAKYLQYAIEEVD